MCHANVPLSGWRPFGFALLVQIGQPVQLGIAIGVVLIHDMDLHLAEVAGEFHLPRRPADPERGTAALGSAAAPA